MINIEQKWKLRVALMRKVFFWLVTGGMLLGCTSGDMVRMARVATTGDLTAAAGHLAVDKVSRYALNPSILKRDVDRMQKDFEKIVTLFRNAVERVWGPRETTEPRPRKYVKYTQNYLSRASVDFDGGVVTVETLDGTQPLASLRNAIVTTLLTPNDPRAVDLYSASSVPLGKTPFLFGEVLDHETKKIRWDWRAERFADHLIKTALTTRKVRTKDRTETVYAVVIPMVRDHLQIRAAKYRELVEVFSKKYSVSKNLVYAVMKTESNFNPYAVSGAPAFGLMQIVPATAGQDVNRLLNRKGIPSKESLFVPGKNIEYGSAYLHLLQSRYLVHIENRVSREYCVIAAYNGGAGSVLRTFDKDPGRASKRINSMGPLEVYNTIENRHPSGESRRYLVKVVSAKKQFVNF
jgi:membrane-bound lytic murein transglycosylase C